MLYILAGLKSLKLSTETGPVGKFEPYGISFIKHKPTITAH